MEYFKLNGLKQKAVLSTHYYPGNFHKNPLSRVRIYSIDKHWDLGQAGRETFYKL